MYLSPLHKEGLAHLLYGIRMGGGFVALTGEVGTGKTTLCHCLLQELPDDIDVALVLNPKLNALELLATICDELGIDYDKEQLSLKQLVDTLNQYLLEAHAKNRRTVLMLDEAQNLSFEVLEQIRLLTNLETYKTKLLQIILVGQPELKELLNHQDLRQLNQRITAKFHLQPLSAKETAEYIQHRLNISGGDSKLFNRAAISKIYQLTSGIPRLINMLCDRALLGAYASGKKLVTPAIVKKAATEVLPDRHIEQSWVIVIMTVVLLAAMGIIFVAGDYIASGNGSLDNGQDITETVAVDTPIVKTEQPKAEVKTEVIVPQMQQEPLSIAPEMDFVGPKRSENVQAEMENVGISENVPGIVTEQTTEVISEPKPTFLSFLEKPDSGVNTAIHAAIEYWGHVYPAERKLDCQFLQTLNLYCLYDKSQWQPLVAFNRPVIMEFVLPGNKIRYGLLSGIRKGELVFHFDKQLSFTEQEVLPYWNGYFLIIWSPPIKNMARISSNAMSSHVLWLRKQLGLWDKLPQDAAIPERFDTDLKLRVRKFQQQHQLDPDGVVGPRTILHLQNAGDVLNFATLETEQ